MADVEPRAGVSPEHERAWGDGYGTSTYRRTPPPPPPSGVGPRRVFALAGILLAMGLSSAAVLRSQDEGGGWVLYLLVVPSVAVVSAIPFVVYLTELRTLFTTMFAGLGLLAVTQLAYLAIMDSAEPGAYFGFVLAPLANLAIVAFGMLVDFFRLGPR